MYAAENGSADAVKVLLDGGADVNVLDTVGVCFALVRTVEL